MPDFPTLNTPATALALFGLAGLAWALWSSRAAIRGRVRRWLRRRGWNARSSAGEPALFSSDSDTRESIEALMAALEALGERVSTRIETQIARVEAVTRRAEETIAKLEARQRQPAAAAIRKPERGGPPSRPPRYASTLPECSDARVQRVHELADAGQSAIDIAARTGMMLGDVELILNLRSFR